MPKSINLHPFTLLALVAAVVTMTTAVGLWWVSCAVLTACALVASWTGHLRRLTVLSAAILIPTFASLLLIHGLVSQETSGLIAAAGPFRVTEGGLETAMVLGLRTAVLVVAGLLCTLLIDKHQLVAAIDLSPAPSQVGYLLAATLFLLPHMAHKQRTIGQAQALRQAGTGRGLSGWFQRVRLRAVPLVLASLQDAHDRSAHLSVRGFPAAGAHTRLRTVADSVTQQRVRWIALLCAVLGPIAILAPFWGSP
ncbi:energy-coupling factor transporter transmembrane component T family protein [Glutamicibacter sp.]|uniref:energy-coupling factor transporter transmembrane component T family protein n=1 Tax=Glutamicibacter sp. TaxID=1931995 RepID=UPI002B4AAA26|nr:energy-coupling factor transporter transmembrane component T [Glutamicibacter sp.]HJX79400.1 energy-coupling factor transporter transmembrane component T [Glutamicibacter sp.]